MIAFAFTPELLADSVTATLLAAVFVLLVYNLWRVRQNRRRQGEAANQNKRLGLVLQSGMLRLWVYDPSMRHYYFLSDSGEYTDEYNPIEFSKFYDRDDFELLRAAVFDVCEGRAPSRRLDMRSSQHDDGKMSHYEVSVSSIATDRHGHVTRVLGLQRDVTDSYLRKQKVSKHLILYHTVFNSSLIDTIYYDKDGILRDINQKACESFGVDREEAITAGFRLQDNPLFNKLDLTSPGGTRSTSIVDFDTEADPRAKGRGPKGKVYYEAIVNPICSPDGDIEGIYMAGRNVTEMVESYYRQREGAEKLRRVNSSIRSYINNINYALSVSNVRIVNYHPDSYILDVSSNVMTVEMQLSQLRCIRLATLRFRRTVSSVLNRMDHRSRHNITELIETEIRDKQGRQIWLMFNFVPVLDAQGRVVKYFGLLRDMTEMVETENRLAVETKKAQETELLKQSFLTNMSYEIRTPLNTVVGFAELFESDHDAEDEPIFVEEIKKNSNLLLSLINDILFLSRLDANMIEYNKQYVDFAQLFEAHCQMGWILVDHEVKTAVESPYEQLVVNIDPANLGIVIERICQLAARYTRQGYIRAKCEYRHGELAIAIEDTGLGIDAATLPHVFERFVRGSSEQLIGSGLDLPIIQEMTQQMGGTVEVQSEQGRGTIVWVIIPCEMQSLKKRIAIDEELRIKI